jgi:DNA-binding beta-propeller fold protein YncE
MRSKIVLSLGGALIASLLPTAGAGAQPATPAPVYAVAGHIPIPDGGFDYSSFDPVHRRVYLSRTGAVLALEVDTKTVTGHLADVQHGHEALPLDQGAMLLVTDSGSNSAHLVDAMSGKLLADVPTGQKPDSALFDPASGLALVMNGRSGDVTLVDPATKAAVGQIAVGAALEFGVSDGAGKVFVNVEDQNRIAVIDTKALFLATHYDLKGCEGPTGMAYAADTGVLIAACANKMAKVIRASDGTDLATLAIGAGPDAVIYDAKRGLAFIPCGHDGVLEVIAVRDAGHIAIVQRLKTQAGAKSGAVDPQTGTLYLPTAHYVAAAGGGKPTATPGSFEFLVVSPAAGR